MSDMPLYIIERHLNDWIGAWARDLEQFPWVEAGYLSEKKKGEKAGDKKDEKTWSKVGLIDQLMTNHANLALLLANAAAINGVSSQQDVQECMKLIRGLSDSTVLRLSEMDGSSQKDRSGLRDKFNDHWFCPLPKKASLEALFAYVRNVSENGGEGCEALSRIGIRSMLAEASLYLVLHEKQGDLAWLESKGMTSQSWVFECYETLVFLWIVQGSLLPSLAPNLYTLGFWEDDKAVLELAKELSLAYEESYGLTKGQARSYLDRIGCELEAISNAPSPGRYSVPDDLRDLLEDPDFMALFDTFCPPQEKARRRSFDMGRLFWDLQNSGFDWINCDIEWAMARARLVVLIMAPAFLGVGAIEGRDSSRAGTLAWLSSKDSLQADRAIGTGSGVVPIAQISDEGGVAASSLFQLNLVSDRRDGLVLLLGHGYDGQHWQDWASKSKSAIEGAFEGFIGELERLVFRDLDEEIGRAGLAGTFGEDEVRRLRQLISDRIQEHLSKVAPERQGTVGTKPGSLLSIGQTGRSNRTTPSGQEGVDTLADVLKSSAFECGEAIKGARGEKLMHKDAAAFGARDITKAISDRFLNTLASLYEAQCCDASQPNGSKSLILDSLDEVAADYRNLYPADPSFDFLLADLKRVLVNRIPKKMVKISAQSPKKEKRLDYEALCDAVNCSFAEYSKKEEELFVHINDGQVSRRHLILYLEKGKLFAADAGSKWGSAVISEEGPDRILTGGRRTDLRSIEKAPWISSEIIEKSRVEVKRGDILRLAGNTTIKVG